MEKQWTFDSDFTRGYTKVRQEFGAEFLEAVRKEIVLESALDMGCGVGYFSRYLSEMGLRVVAVDGREENVEEGKRRYPEITFLTRNVEDPAVLEIGSFDFVLCVGLLYHLENPFRAIRNLHALTGKILLLESMSAPGDGVMMELLDEGRDHDQGLNYVAFYPTEACLVKMLYRAGFPFVYQFRRLPDDDLFKGSLLRKRQRTFLAASRVSLSLSNLTLAKERFCWAGTDLDPWATRVSKAHHLAFQLRVLAAKALRQMLSAVGAKSR